LESGDCYGGEPPVAGKRIKSRKRIRSGFERGRILLRVDSQVGVAALATMPREGE